VISISSIEGELKAVRISEDDVEAVILPELGGKIASLCWRGKELLACNPERPFQLARYAAPYADYDASGFDECFPTIGPCQYPDDPWKGVELPDHGELWSIPWQSQIEDNSLHLSAHGIRIPYRFEKWICIPGNGRLHIHYLLTNLTPFPFRYLWSSHPLIAPQPDMRIYLPEGIKVRVDWSKGGRLGGLLSEHDWPHSKDCQSNPVDLSLVLSREAQLVDKLYTSRLEEGWCLVHDPSSKIYVAFLFSPENTPYVGLSINMGGWPEDKSGEKLGYYNLGIEPCNGYPDRLDIAVEKGDCPTLAPYASVNWDLELCVGEIEDISLLYQKGMLLL
jgi:hypothetical protein